jgi:hypothetical protein
MPRKACARPRHADGWPLRDPHRRRHAAGGGGPRDQANRRATIDFTGTGPQRPDNFNAPAAVCRAVVLYCFRALVGSDIPLNDGCLKPLEIIVPPAHS